MFHPAIQDLVKAQWLAVLAQCKRHGSRTISEMSESTGCSYMTTKSHCEGLVNLGYLERTRIPRSHTGRPEIAYSLTVKASSLFFSPDQSLSLGILAEARLLFGEIAPERMVNGWFQKLALRWRSSLDRIENPIDKARHLAGLRCQSGWLTDCEENPLRLIDYHHPLHRILAVHPRVKVIEKRILESLLGKIIRSSEIPTGRGAPPILVHEIA